jgi:hypothetical protein
MQCNENNGKWKWLHIAGKSRPARPSTGVKADVLEKGSLQAYLQSTEPPEDPHLQNVRPGRLCQIAYRDAVRVNSTMEKRRCCNVKVLSRNIVENHTLSASHTRVRDPQVGPFAKACLVDLRWPIEPRVV